MRTGRPPKPTEQKRKLGNPGRRQLPSGSLAVVPVQSRHLGMELSALEAVEMVLDEGVVWLGQSDVPTIVALREVLAKREQIESTDLKLWIELTKAATSLMSQLGFDPTARARLGLAEIKAASKLDQLKGRGSKVADKGAAG